MRNGTRPKPPGAQLTREIAERGYPGTRRQVQRYLRRRRTRTGHMPVPAPRPPSVRDMTRWIMTVDRKFVVEPGGILIVAG
ncbi:hypothetical protein IFM12275_64000 [Nocardia sputorum]|nr:hypothetical protein IFM12275_64000 [Nocardia sputorum]